MKNFENNIINIESITDLHKIPFNIIKSKKLYEFKGKYFDKIYQEALELEKKELKKKPLIKFTYSKISKKDKFEDGCENNKFPKNKTSKGLINKKEKNNSVHKDKENQELRAKDKRNSLQIDIIDEKIDLGRLRINSSKISSGKNKEFKIKKIEFQMYYNTSMGEEVGLIGSIKELGSWDKNKVLRMHWDDGNIWTATIDFSFVEITSFEFKFILIDNGKIKEWENGNNRIFNINEFKLLIRKKIQGKNNKEEIDYDYILNENTLILKCIWNKKK